MVEDRYLSLAALLALLPLSAQADGVQKIEKIEVTGHYQSSAGGGDAASTGTVTQQLIDDRPLLRPGEVLEYIPGMIVTQHSGAGKANQYFLRGFNLDHGTDFATWVAGMPVNTRSHAHGQGYTDLNFMIPELIAHIDYSKGPYSAAAGDFATAGSAAIHYLDKFDKGVAAVSGGSNGGARMLLAGSADVGPGAWLYAFEAIHDNGPWEVAQNYRKYNGVLRYTLPVASGVAGVTAMAYDGRWTSTDQIPRRAVDSGLAGRFGSLNNSDGGLSHRYSLSADYEWTAAGQSVQSTAYAIDYALDLYSDFTYFLDNPAAGDQFNQVDKRKTFGWIGNWTRDGQWFARPAQSVIGWELRQDRIAPLGLYRTVRRLRTSTTREDAVRETSAALFYQHQVQWADWLRTVAGMRVERFVFDVSSNVPENSGTSSAGIGLPKLSLILGPWHKTEIFLNFGQGFHSNDARGVVGRVDPATREPASAATPLARAKGGEIGVKTEAVRGLTSALTAWSLRLASELVFAGDSGTTEPSRPSRRVGVEWTNHYAPTHWLLLDLDLAWTRARFTDSSAAGKEVPNALRWTAQAGATIHNGSWTLALFGRYFGPRTLVEDGSVKSASTTVFNLQGSYAVGANTSLRVDVFNLLNTKADDITYYYTSRLPGEPAGGIADLHSHPMERRTARVSINYAF